VARWLQCRFERAHNPMSAGQIHRSQRCIDERLADAVTATLSWLTQEPLVRVASGSIGDPHYVLPFIGFQPNGLVFESRCDHQSPEANRATLFVGAIPRAGYRHA
jgi:hypothetical protein